MKTVQQPPREWRVIVHSLRGDPDVGSVMEGTEELARCAALSKFGTEGERGASPEHAIFENDDFDVRAS